MNKEDHAKIKRAYIKLYTGRKNPRIKTIGRHKIKVMKGITGIVSSEKIHGYIIDGVKFEKK
tara:strand:- start:3454 stop:3639 length:186 start_codon:yes stop_codon:yes gene_type:complete